MNAVIFDFDGTIADSFEPVLSFLLKISGKNAADITPAEHQQLKSLSMKDLALRVGVPSWRLPFIYFQGKAALARHMRQVALFQGMDVVLKTLHDEQYQLFIISSNGRRNINRFLVQHGLSGYFTRIYSNAGWFGKGLVLRRALKQNNLRSDATVYVGDEVRDIIGSHLAGTPSVAVVWGFGSEQELLKYSPTVLVRTPEELQKTLVDWGLTV